MYGDDDYVTISPEQLLQKVTQEQIFSFVFDCDIDLTERYLSIFRKDTKPGCRFETRKDGTILFVDFGEKHVTGKTHRSCFGAVRDRFGCKDMYSVMEILCNRFGLSKSQKDYEPAIRTYLSTTEDQKIVTYNKRVNGYNRSDILEWSQYLISPDDLLSDNVFSIRSFSVIKSGFAKSISTYRHAYAMDFYTKVKIYQPYSEKYKWISTCDENCIGNSDNLPSCGDSLIIKKSYKDHRVIRNLFPDKNVVWFQNEGCIPDLAIIANYIERFNHLIYFYDNDTDGILAANKLVEVTNNIRSGSATSIHLPHGSYKDPAQLVRKEGRVDSIKILKSIGL